MKRSPLLAVLIFIIAVSASVVYAGGPKKPKDWKPAAWKVPKEQFNVISAVNPSAGTVSIHHQGGKDKQDRDLTVTAFTDIIVDGQKASFASLKAGMHVDYTLGGDGSVAARIETKAEHAPPPTPVATATPSFPTGNKKK